MQVSNDILQKFAKIVDPNDNKKEPLLEFYGKVIEQIDETHWKVRPSVGDEITKEIELPDSGNMLTCSSQVDVKDGDEVRYKVEGNNAVIIENKTNPSGNTIIIKHFESEELSYVESNNSSHSGYLKYTIPESILSELLDKNTLIGIGSLNLKVKRVEAYGRWPVQDVYTYFWQNEDALYNLNTTTALLGYNLIYDTENNKPVSASALYGMSSMASRYKFKVCMDLTFVNSNSANVIN